MPERRTENRKSKPLRWRPPARWQSIETIDMHTCGEPLRVIVSGLPALQGNTILEKRKYFCGNFDYIRKGLMWEPRGHADMYGVIITEPETTEANFGAVFLHNEGYSTMCGHGIIALVKFAIETGLVQKEGNVTGVTIDTPAGMVKAKALVSGNRVQSVSFLNVPSFVLYKNQKVVIDDFGIVVFSIAFGGAFYAIVDAEMMSISLVPENLNQLIDLGKKIKKAIRANYPVTHPFEEDLSFLYGILFTGLPEKQEHHSRNVCIFANGEVDRSPTGTGISARSALHYFNNELPEGSEITIESILGTTMKVKVAEETTFGKYRAVIPEVTGNASFTGRNQFFFDPDDPVREGFIFR